MTIDTYNTTILVTLLLALVLAFLGGGGNGPRFTG